MSTRITTRAATPADAEVMAAIYSEGIADRTATFETRPRAAADVRAWLDGPRPVVVALEGERVVAYAAAFPYSPRACYDGVAEMSVYVARSARGRGAGRAAGETLLAAAEAAGLWKLVGKIFPENAASLALVRALGFRVVGVHEHHARLDGVWRDVILVERLLGEARRA